MISSMKSMKFDMSDVLFKGPRIHDFLVREITPPFRSSTDFSNFW